MKNRSVVFCVVLTLPCALAQLSRTGGRAEGATKPLDVKIDRFDASDAVFRDGLSVLSLNNVEGLHLGFEEVIRNKIQDDPRAQGPTFSIHLEGKTVREILDELCRSDVRYVWSEDEYSVNVYPRETIDDSDYLLNLWIGNIAVTSIPDPDQALTPLSKLFPHQQIGYFGPGLGDNSYGAPWSVHFENLRVRQFINRVSEHMGPRTSWVWEGGRQERMFTFLKGGFHSR